MYTYPSKLTLCPLAAVIVPQLFCPAVIFNLQGGFCAPGRAREWKEKDGRETEKEGWHKRIDIYRVMSERERESRRSRGREGEREVTKPVDQGEAD